MERIREKRWGVDALCQLRNSFFFLFPKKFSASSIELSHFLSCFLFLPLLRLFSFALSSSLSLSLSLRSRLSFSLSLFLYFPPLHQQ